MPTLPGRNKSGRRFPPFLRQIKALRREVKLCEDIAARSLSLKEKIRAAREEQQAGKTEKTREEQGRRKRLERR